ncbi:MAG: hypothetical protein CMF49_07570 [Legionellales bacterium]|nr:hypothetical protein [Legionellales bacterium]
MDNRSLNSQISPISSTMLINTLHTDFSRVISLLHLTTATRFLQACTRDSQNFFSILCSLGAEVHFLFETLFEKKLSLTSIKPTHINYQYEKTMNKQNAYNVLLSKVSQIISLITLGADSLFIEICHEDKLNFIYSIKDILEHAKVSLELLWLPLDLK